MEDLPSKSDGFRIMLNFVMSSSSIGKRRYIVTVNEFFRCASTISRPKWHSIQMECFARKLSPVLSQPNSCSSFCLPAKECNIPSTATRCFSNPTSWEAEYEGLKSRRNKNIIMHPKGYGQHIIPGNFVVKKHPKTGEERKVFLEHALGYFWALKVCVAIHYCHHHIKPFFMINSRHFPFHFSHQP